MKLIILIYLFALTQAVYSQDKKYIIYYNQGQYEKCIKLADNAIERDKKDFDAYLYKSLSLAQISQIEKYNNTYSFSAEKALKTLVTLKKKDKSDTFLILHTKELEYIRNTTYQKAEYFASAEGCEDAIKVYTLLIELFPDYLYYYHKGKCLIEIGAIAAGGDYLILAAKKIYLDFQEGIPAKEEQQEVFTELTVLLFKYGFKKEAFTVIKRAVVIFPQGEQVRISYGDLIEKNLAALDLNSPDSVYLNLFYESDTATKTFTENKNLIDIKWKVAEAYINFLNYRKESNNLKSFIRNQVSAPQVADENTFQIIKEILLNQIIINTKENNDHIPVPDNLSKEASIMLIYLLSLKNPVSDEKNAALIVRELLQNDQIKKAGVMIVNFSEVYNNKLAILKIRDELITVIMSKISTDFESWRVLLFWKKFFDDDLRLAAKSKELTYYLADYYIFKKQDLSKAHTVLAEELKVFPADQKLQNFFKQSVIQDFMINYKGTEISKEELNWTGNIEKCLAGNISEVAIKKVLRRLNYYRRLAGVPDECIFDENLNKYAQQAAFLMAANNRLSHAPEKNWFCYSDSAFKGASNSNLSFGSHSVYGLTDQLQDAGENNYFAGHRRWILNPYNKVFGVGSTNSTMALWALPTGVIYSDSLTVIYKQQFVSWPPAGYVPEMLVFMRWSFSLTGADFSHSTIRMFHDNTPVDLKIEELKDGYGQPTIVWVPENIPVNHDQEVILKIEINQVRLTKNNESKNYEYTVTFLPGNLFR